MARLRNSIREDTRFRILRLVSENSHLSQRELADAVGISAGSAHYVLNALIEAGMVKFGNFKAAEDRRRYAYVLTPDGLAERDAMAQRFLARKVEEFEALRLEIEALRGELEVRPIDGVGGLAECRADLEAAGGAVRSGGAI